MSQAETSKLRGVRWSWIIVGLLVILVISALFVRKMEGSIQYYVTVSEYRHHQAKYIGKTMKVAGRVKPASLTHEADRYSFVIEDLGQELAVRYQGVVPDTFKEEAEVVVEGRSAGDDLFEAQTVIAKCASRYEGTSQSPLEQMRYKARLAQ